MVKIKTSDNCLFEIEFRATDKSDLIKNIISDIPESDIDIIPVNNVTGKTMKIIVDYLNSDKIDFSTYQLEEMFDIILAANFMSIEHLLDIGCRDIAKRIHDKPVDEIKKIFQMN